MPSVSTEFLKSEKNPNTWRSEAVKNEIQKQSIIDQFLDQISEAFVTDLEWFFYLHLELFLIKAAIKIENSDCNNIIANFKENDTF